MKNCRNIPEEAILALRRLLLWCGAWADLEQHELKTRLMRGSRRR